MRIPERESIPGSRRVIANRYEIDLEQPFRPGGMAMVYVGHDLKMHRKIAVKTLRPEYQRDPESQHRFRREARMLAMVPHPNLVTIYDYRDDTSGSWIVMEFVEGQNLREVLDDEGPLDPESVMVILDQVGKALSQMHRNNVVHLDLKPQNLMWTPDGKIKLIDFGVAQHAGSPQEMIGGSAFGTAAYLAPEQASGAVVDAATDLYALGCVVYELLTGQAPFVAGGEDEKRKLIDAHLNARPQPPSTVRPELNLPEWIDDVLGWALAKDPRDRFASVDTFVRMFEAGLDGQAVRSPAEETRRIEVQEREPADRTGIFRRRQRPPQSRQIERDDDVEWDGHIRDVRPLDDSTTRRWYRKGGRMARRSRFMRRRLWRLVALFAIANVILAMVLMVRDGPGALVERFLSFAPGTSTEVVTSTLNIRAGPGTDSPVILVLGEGDEVRIAGLSGSSDQGRWWPVEIDQGDQTIDGWAWEGGLQPNAWTGRLSWMQDIADGVTTTRDQVRAGVDRVLDFLPGVMIPPWNVVTQSQHFLVKS